MAVEEDASLPVEHRVLDTCPKPAENLICLIGLRNTCFDDASCRQGTLCCNDGCRKRCRDPSLFSRGATEGKPRPGTCPSLTPPSEYCPSDYDECKYDWDCEGTTKKCCSNGCYRVCAEPAALGEVRDKCPAPKAHKRCHLTLRNQCSNHVDCSYDPNGLCCYDGCRRRCATLGGFISELQLNQTRPGKCPRLLQPEFCVADYDECENDADCFPGKKCCSNDCFNRCVNPSFEATVSLIIASKCPNTQPLKKCHVGLKHTCNDDVECVNGTYCCFTGCRRQCWDPDARGSAALNKTGTCPILPTPPPPCVSDVDECFMDNDCVKTRSAAPMDAITFVSLLRILWVLELLQSSALLR
ncbi:hypothetical protein OS493_010818 [Desmophyllum pertusum]|uniref:WAP domain-containing protein n=1 Tax=Desmophyllum pertusum TaxID=174260 RepID=A0A9W9ZEH6_9CNID|nr:hypothetical protein OS493_010818 [Desmophyllum pertusum]